MNRRAFFASLAAGLTLDPEKLLWLPGRKLISIPAQTREISGARLFYNFRMDQIVEVVKDLHLIRLFDRQGNVISTCRYSPVLPIPMASEWSRSESLSAPAGIRFTDYHPRDSLLFAQLQVDAGT